MSAQSSPASLPRSVLAWYDYLKATLPPEALQEAFAPFRERPKETERKSERVVPPFSEWLPQVTPQWDWEARHLLHIQAALERVTSGTSRYLMLFLPPRHGKSQLTTIRYPVWRLEREPATRVCVGCYNQSFADKFGRTARRIALSRFPLAGDRKAAREWETPEGGVFRACGVGSPPTGEGFNLLIVDDPVKSRKEADSEAYREQVWDWYNEDLFTRREPGCAIVLIMTRWHEDDLAGRLLESEGKRHWEVVNLPAEAEDGDPLGRQPGEALWPVRFDKEALAEILTQQGTYAYSALYQQRPSPKEGRLFKWAWFDSPSRPKLRARPEQATRVRYWDMAGTEGDGDFTAGVLVAKTPESTYIVEDVKRGQWSPHRRNQEIKAIAERDGKDVAIWIEQEAGIQGAERTKALIGLLSGFSARAEHATGSKEQRADPFAAQAEAGNVRLLKGAWNYAFLSELAGFPMGKWDDQVDAVSGAFAQLVSGKTFWAY